MAKYNATILLAVAIFGSSALARSSSNRGATHYSETREEISKYSEKVIKLAEGLPEPHKSKLLAAVLLAERKEWTSVDEYAEYLSAALGTVRTDYPPEKSHRIQKGSEDLIHKIAKFADDTAKNTWNAVGVGVKVVDDTVKNTWNAIGGVFNFFFGKENSQK